MRTSSRLTAEQIKRLLELDEESGIGERVQDLIADLEIARASQDPFAVQTEKLWSLGWGEALGYASLDTYRASVPRVPDRLNADDPRFPDLVLVDARIPLVQACRLAHLVETDVEDEGAKHTPDVVQPQDVYWIRCQDGHRYYGKSDLLLVCHMFDNDEVGLTAMEGVALDAQRPALLEKHFLWLPGSRASDGDSRYTPTFAMMYMANQPNQGGPGLYYCGDAHDETELKANEGVASRRR